METEIHIGIADEVPKSIVTACSVLFLLG